VVQRTTIKRTNRGKYLLDAEKNYELRIMNYELRITIMNYELRITNYELRIMKYELL